MGPKGLGFGLALSALGDSIQTEISPLPLDSLRAWLLRVWRRHITKKALAFLRSCTLPSDSEIEGARECILKAARADWWEWKGAQGPLLLKMALAHRDHMRKGHPVYVKGTLPHYKRPQPNERDRSLRTKVHSKLENVLDKGYIRPGRVASLTGYFSIPKGLSDVRMVYDASRSGLNDALWSPNFGLPTVETLLRGVGFGTWMGDIGLGEMFPSALMRNFMHSVVLKCPHTSDRDPPRLGGSGGSDVLWALRSHPT